jgi:hypothetical protein
MIKLPSSIANSRRRRQIRARLDDVARVIGSQFRGAVTDCAVITREGDILTGKGGSPRPFIQLVPKIRALRKNSATLSMALAVPVPRILHVRGHSWMAGIYSLGPHSLVIFTPASLRISEDNLRALDEILTTGDVEGVIDDLEHLVLEI